MLLKKQYWINLLLLLCATKASAQQVDTLVPTSKTYKTIAITALSTTAIATHAMLYTTWYSKEEKSKFHWFNDNAEWLQIDKVGHAWSTYVLSEISYKTLSKAGYKPRQAQNIALATALGFQYAIEYFDGHSKAWGASWGDLAANTAGGLWSYGQRRVWGKIKIPFGFTPSFGPYAQLRPSVLGSTLPTRLLKDYNAQTYWLSFIPNNWIPKSKWPKWLGISLGYGAHGLLGGHSNKFVSNGITYDYSAIPRIRQFYLSPRITLSHIHTRKKWVNTLCKATDYIRIPLPTLLYTQNQFHGRWISL